MTSEITPYSSSFFAEIRKEAKALQSEISQLDKARERRQKLFDDCMNQYQRYIYKENDLLHRNQKHCQNRNKWYLQEVNKSWRTAISNRPIILRSVARTNVMKKDIDDWLNKVQQQPVYDDPRDSFYRDEGRESLEGSKLIDKYNQILYQYGHKM